MSDCRCYNPPFYYLDYVSTPIGIDMTRGRHGEVSVETCVHCGTKWLNYLYEHEAFSESGRWFRGTISDESLETLRPEDAVPYLDQLPWHFSGGSFYRSTGRRSSSKILF